MGEITEFDCRRVMQGSTVDELSRNRGAFEYAADTLSEHSVFPYSIWSNTNPFVRKVISGEIAYDSLPTDFQNDDDKCMLFHAQAEFVARHSGQPILCEALGAQACRLIDCPLFIEADQTRHQQPMCREWKLIFAKH